MPAQEQLELVQRVTQTALEADYDTLEADETEVMAFHCFEDNGFVATDEFRSFCLKATREEILLAALEITQRAINGEDQ